MIYNTGTIFKIITTILFSIIPGSIFLYISYSYHNICDIIAPDIKYSYLGLLQITSYLNIIHGLLIIFKEYTNLIISIILDIFISILITGIFIVNSFIIVLYYETILINCKNTDLISFSKIFYIYYMIMMPLYILISSLILSVFNSYTKYKKEKMYNLINGGTSHSDSDDFLYI